MQFPRWFIISVLCVLLCLIANAPLGYASTELSYQQQLIIFDESNQSEIEPDEFTASEFLQPNHVQYPECDKSCLVTQSFDKHTIYIIRAPPTI
ncbi:hypothetical protein [Pseudoalteromonas sp. MMG012]|uniref:hypothetical protein n=1 Tax=Pseudoalteromonas sp. MMG012 TaxID=2822686 RepID=UPI001B39F7DC|nr:hypothetical protein [Pseudoalteromonas sp. MMG012]MBQ4851496.1 hypothetical protein [Pseudoalteromonas sp. MMG012]